MLLRHTMPKGQPFKQTSQGEELFSNDQASIDQNRQLADHENQRAEGLNSWLGRSVILGDLASSKRAALNYEALPSTA